VEGLRVVRTTKKIGDGSKDFWRRNGMRSGGRLAVDVTRRLSLSCGGAVVGVVDLWLWAFEDLRLGLGIFFCGFMPSIRPHVKFLEMEIVISRDKAYNLTWMRGHDWLGMLIRLGISSHMLQVIYLHKLAALESSLNPIVAFCGAAARSRQKQCGCFFADRDETRNLVRVFSDRHSSTPDKPGKQESSYAIHPRPVGGAVAICAKLGAVVMACVAILIPPWPDAGVVGDSRVLVDPLTF
jgi:hypothetical protein